MAPSVALVVDGDRDHRAFLGAVLEKLGFALKTADGAAAALDAGRGGGVHVVVAKLRLPDRSALDLIRDLRAAGVEAPAVLLSDAFTRKELEAAIRLSRACCLPLPVRVRGLQEALDRLLSSRRADSPR